MAYPQTMGLPSTLDYKMPPSLGQGCRSTSVSVSPDGITQVTSAPFPSTFALNSTFTQASFGGGQQISFTIPSGQGRNQFLSPWDTTLSFSVSYTPSTASSVTGGNLNLVGSAASFFESLTLYSNNVPIEQIGSYGALQNFLLQNTVSSSERLGGISVAMGTDNSTASNGHEYATATTSLVTYNYCIPLCSIIGYNSDRLIPIGSLSNLQLQMTICSGNFPFVSFCSAVAAAGSLGPLTLNNFFLNMKYVTLDDMSSAMLNQTLQDGKWFVRATTYTQSSVSLPIGSSGAQQLLLQIRNSSVRSVLGYFFTTSDNVRAPNGQYDAMGILTNSRQLQVGSAYFPNRPINDLVRPAEGYCYLIQSLSGVASPVKALGSVVSRETYNSHFATAAANVPAGSDSSIVVPGGTMSRPAASGSDIPATNGILRQYPSAHYHGYDLEVVNSTLLSGLNTRASPPFVNLNIAVATIAVMNLIAWGMSDVVLAFDVNSQTVQAFI